MLGSAIDCIRRRADRLAEHRSIGAYLADCLVCVGWGHSTYRHAFEFAARVGAKRIVPFHHDPSHDDETLDRLLDHALAAFKCPCAVSPGREGTTFELGS
jgi:ribonuclease BN (tRNA processing enzyme)